MNVELFQFRRTDHRRSAEAWISAPRRCTILSRRSVTPEAPPRSAIELMTNDGRTSADGPLPVGGQRVWARRARTCLPYVANRPPQSIVRWRGRPDALHCRTARCTCCDRGSGVRSFVGPTLQYVRPRFRVWPQPCQWLLGHYNCPLDPDRCIAIAAAKDRATTLALMPSRPVLLLQLLADGADRDPLFYLCIVIDLYSGVCHRGTRAISIKTAAVVAATMRGTTAATSRCRKWLLPLRSLPFGPSRYPSLTHPQRNSSSSQRRRAYFVCCCHVSSNRDE
jgi:hypothetical protein